MEWECVSRATASSSVPLRGFDPRGCPMGAHHAALRCLSAARARLRAHPQQCASAHRTRSRPDAGRHTRAREHPPTHRPSHPPSHPPYLPPSHRRTLPPALAHIITRARAARTHTLTTHPTHDVFAPSMSGMSFRPVARGPSRACVCLCILRVLASCRKCTNCTSTAALAARRCSSRRRRP
jgi:hypothetical protein